MKNKTWLITTLVLTLILPACKSSQPIGIQVAKPLEAGFVKGPALISYGKFYFMEKEAIYKPYKWYFINFQKAQNFPYAAIDTVENSNLFGILLVIANLKMEDGKKYKIRINHKYKFDATLNGLK